MTKPAIVTFKADPSLLEAMEGIPNRSEFIRNAVLAALQSVCPLCQGTGILTPNQKRHWDAFADQHKLHKCSDCSELHIICEQAPDTGIHA